MFLQLVLPGVKELKILISPQMVDFNKNVKVMVNGKITYLGKVKVDIAFVNTQFSNDIDRKAVWLTSIITNVNP